MLPFAADMLSLDNCLCKGDTAENVALRAPSEWALVIVIIPVIIIIVVIIIIIVIIILVLIIVIIVIIIVIIKPKRGL